MELVTLIQIFISIFAVFGIYAFMREIIRIVGSRQRYFVAYEIKFDEDLEILYEQLYEAITVAQGDARFRKVPVLILPRDIDLDDEMLDLLKEWNVKLCYARGKPSQTEL